MRQAAHHPRFARRRATNTPRPSQWTAALTRNTDTSIDLKLLRATISPLYFATHVLGFHPEPAQEHVLRHAHFFKRIALNCNRQWGKSTIAAILIVHRLLTQPRSLVLIVAPADRQSGETYLKVKDFLQILGTPHQNDGVNPRSMVFENGSRLVSLPGVDGTTRGFSSVSLLVFDEAARIKDRIYLAFRPMIGASNGDLLLISTPTGRRGFFYREMTGLEPKTAELWFRHTGPVHECIPRISQEFIEEEKAAGDRHFRQEWLCEFTETGIYVMDQLTIDKIVKKEIKAHEWI